MSVKKQIELEELRRKEMRDREDEYKDRIRVLQEWRKAKEQEEIVLSDNRLKVI
jgi:hypothetical protein